MKSLHKKIGVVVLAGALLMGVGGLSSSSVVHASFSFKELKSKIPENYKHREDDIGELISNNGRLFSVMDIYGPGQGLKGSKHFAKYLEKDIDDSFINLFKNVVKRKGGAEELDLKKGYFYQLNLEGLKILIKVW